MRWGNRKREEERQRIKRIKKKKGIQDEKEEIRQSEIEREKSEIHRKIERQVR
jgi:hypothetical protein